MSLTRPAAAAAAVLITAGGGLVAASPSGAAPAASRTALGLTTAATTSATTSVTTSVTAGSAIGRSPKDDAKTASALRAMASPKVTWTRCGSGLQCATLEVPLDYNDPTLGTTTLSISRRPADNPSQRIGSLFTNPGGPGGPATQTVGYFAKDLGAQVRKRFDIVGVGPRGIEGQDLAMCFGKPGEQMPQLDEHAFPLWDKEFAQHLAYDRAYRKTCATAMPRILKHMSTADTARDMDLARRALGDKQISYYGISYGSYLGATYAALYPNNIRALVVDGVLDPVAWATGRGGEHRTKPVTERLKSHLGAHEALMSAFTECERGGTSLCAEAKTVRKDWEAILATLSKGPVDMGDGNYLRYDDVIGLALQVLYSADDIPQLMPLITELRQAVAPTTPKKPARKASGSATADGNGTAGATATPKAAVARLKALAAKVDREHPAPAPLSDSTAPKNAHRTNGPLMSAGALRSAPVTSASSSSSAPAAEEPPGEPAAPVYSAGFHGVLCSDSLNPQDPKAWITADRRVKWQAPGFGPAWLWSSSVCAGWPGMNPDAYRGPFTKATSTPVLIIGNHHDPATPYSGAVAYRKELKTSRLITLTNGYGHGALGVSTCVDKLRTQYLVNRLVPASDTSCKPDHPLFTRLD